MKKSKFLLFYVIFILFCLLSAIVILLGADYYLHYRFKESTQGSYNWRGYRGNVVKKKQKNEIRIACFGGSTTFGYGVHWKDTWPYLLEQLLQNDLYKFSVVNLGANCQGIYGISYDVKYYNYLNYDIAIIYNGYNDSDPKDLNTASFRGKDGFFRIFGYKLILPLYLSERSKMLMYKEKLGKVNKAKREGRLDELEKTKGIKFQLGVSMEKLNQIIKSVDKRLNQFDSEAKEMIKKNNEPYGNYLLFLQKTFDWLTLNNKTIFYICQPGWFDKVQQQLVREFINEKYDNVYYINLSYAVDLKNKKLCYDGSHLTGKGNKLIAQSLKPYIQECIR